jgi:hypothetical protein
MFVLNGDKSRQFEYELKANLIFQFQKPGYVREVQKSVAVSERAFLLLLTLD